MTKSICNTLVKPIARCFKEGIKATYVAQKTKTLEIKDSVDIAEGKMQKQQVYSYNPFVSKKFNSLFDVPKQNFSSGVKFERFYSSITCEKHPIDVTSDYVFKGIFGDEARAKNFLESILIGKNKILPEGTEIQGLQYLKNEHIQNKAPEDAKKTIFDLQIKTNNGIFIIEMQKNVSPEYLKRIEFYNATAYSHQQIKNGQSTMKDYTNAVPLVTISVMSKNLFDDTIPCISYHVNMERKTQEQHMKAFSYVFIELEKFDTPEYDQTNIIDDAKDWLSFMKNQKLDPTYHNKEVNSAVKYVQDIRDNNYEEYVRFQMSEIAVLKEKESVREEGIKIGEAKGIEKIAKNMLKKNKPIEEISEFTGLSKEDIEKIK